MPSRCYVCKQPGDLCPYGERGQTICFACMKASPEREAEAKRQFGAHLDAIKEDAVVLTPHGPVPASSMMGGSNAT